MRRINMAATLIVFSLLASVIFGELPMTAAELEHITIQFRWYHQFQFAGYYAAVEQGFFSAEGLDVSLRERSWESSPVQDVLAGHAEYGVSDATLLIDRVRGQPVVLLAQIFQHAPGVLMSLSDSGITSPMDLVGKKVMTVSDDAGVQAMLLNELGDLSKIEIIEHPGNFDPFTTGEVDAMAGYVSNEPFLLKQEGYSLYIMDPRDYGIDQYGDNLFTTQEELRDHPDRVARVIRAVIKGWEYAFEHPDELIDLILSKYAPGKTREHLEFEAKMTEMLVLPDLVPIGVISASRYARIAGNFAQLGFVENEGIPEGFIYVPPVSARSGLDLSYQEEAWLDEHAIVSLLVSSDLVPYAYMEDGEFVGVLADICARMESLLGITFVYAPIDREAMKQQIVGSDQLVVAGLDPWDVSSLVLYERTQEIVAMPFALFAINENDVHDEGFQDRAHVRIAIRQDWDLAHPALQALQPCEFVLGASVLECINMVLRGEADAVFDIASVITGLLSQHLIHNIRMVEVFNQGQPLVIHIRKDWPELRSALDKALDVIAPAERISLLESWNAYSEDPSFRLVAVSLTEEERKWLLEHPVIRVGSDPAWAPIEFRDDQGRYQGVAVDYLHAVQDLLGIYFEIVSGLAKPDLIHQAQTREIDMLASLAATDERSQYLTFTRPYISLPVNIFTRDDVAYIASPGDLVGKRVAVVSGYAVEQWLAHDYPGIELVQTATTIEALERLQQQDVFAFVGNLVTTGYYLGLTKAVDIKVVGDTEYDYQQAMGVRSDWPLLASILQKALDAIPTSQQNEIQRSWLSVSYEYGFDYRRLWQVLIAAMIVVGVIAGAFLYWNRRLSREIRGRRNAELDLLHAKELAEDANRAKSKFLANMSHEIRTPMNAVLGYAHLLRNETGMTVEQREYLNSISRSGTHLLGLLDDVLDMSKIEAGRLTINHAPFDLHTLVDDLEMMFRIRAQAKGVRIETSIADGVPQYVRGDEGKVRQILINILGNATKFTDRGMIRLRLWCSPELAHQKEDRPSLPQSCQEDARIICFEVEDTGRGIDKSDLKTIFEAFERPHTENAHAGGTGLGLAISRQYAEAMGGSIAVESEWGEGSRFRFCMPIDEVFFRDSEDSTPCRTSSPLPAVGSEIRLLIVDPKSANREAVIRMLEPLNLSIRETSDNEEALRVFQEWRPHVILMDLSDCTMNQSFAIEEIRKIEREMLASDDDCGHVTIIAVAVNPQDEERLRTTIAGVDAFLARPLEQALLWHVLGANLTRRGSSSGAGLEDDDVSRMNPLRMNRDELDSLPQDLLQRLRDAVIVGDVGRLEEIASEISQNHAEMGTALREIIHAYRHGELRELLQKGRTDHE